MSVSTPSLGAAWARASIGVGLFLLVSSSLPAETMTVPLWSTLAVLAGTALALSVRALTLTMTTVFPDPQRPQAGA